MSFDNQLTSPLRLREHTHALGPMPKVSLEIFVDLGLTDMEIGHYFKVAQICITELREIWGTGPIVCDT